ncbi:WecB/TagA/CpsF family glycosyltransferase [Candidatus Gottesmanbacteria bacterium]|nr:WecB/TagA/CpsF family glycosyltransferase [Candidatus Gottesmanbacteria bacterium]
MSLKSTKILGISVTTESKKTILEYIEKYLEEAISDKRKVIRKDRNPLIIVTPNPEQIGAAQEDPQFAKILNKADVALPDGIGVALAAWFLNFSLFTFHFSLPLRRIPGIEFMEALVELAATKGFRIGLIGGRGAVAVQALECLKHRYPGLTGWAVEAPEFTVRSQGDLSKYELGIMNYGLEQKDKEFSSMLHNSYLMIHPTDDIRNYVGQIASHIVKSGTRIIFVGLGAPKQEFFVERLAYHLSLISYHCAVMSVGGSFDIIAGRVPRAPLLLRTIGVEWLWRLVREPWRFGRQLRLLQFLWMVLKSRE